VISQAGQPEGQPDLKKPTALRGEVGVWDCESSDRIKGLMLIPIRSFHCRQALVCLRLGGAVMGNPLLRAQELSSLA
jgi:hypothetical protein